MIVRLFAIGVLFSSQLLAAECPLTSGKYVTEQMPFGDAYIRAQPDFAGRCEVHIQIGAAHWYFTSKSLTRWHLGWDNVDIKSEKEFYFDRESAADEDIRYTLEDASQIPSPRFKSSSLWERIQGYENSDTLDLLDKLAGEYQASEIIFHIKGKPHEFFQIEDGRRIIFKRPWMSTGLKIPTGQFHYDIKACLKSRPQDCDRLSLTFEILE